MFNDKIKVQMSTKVEGLTVSPNGQQADVSRSFILQTAADYDMDVADVEKIYNAHSGYGFYIELEKFIEQRSQNCG